MIETIAKIVSPLEKLLNFLFRYYREKPEITLTLMGSGCAQGPSHIPNAVYFRWYRDLILHNDSAHLIRGIKLLRTFPPPWSMGIGVPSRLEPDVKVKIPIQARIEENHQILLDRYGVHVKQRFSDAVFPSIVDNVELEFELINEKGRKVYQYSTLREDGTIETKIFSKRRSIDSQHAKQISS